MEFIAVANVQPPPYVNLGELVSTSVSVSLVTDSGTSLASGSIDVTNVNQPQTVFDSTDTVNQVFASIPAEGVAMTILTAVIGGDPSDLQQQVQAQDFQSALKNTIFDSVTSMISSPATTQVDGFFQNAQSSLNSAITRIENQVSPELQPIVQPIVQQVGTALSSELTSMNSTIDKGISAAAGVIYQLTPADQVADFIGGGILKVEGAAANFLQTLVANAPVSVTIQSTLTSDAINGILLNSAQQAANGVPLQTVEANAETQFLSALSGSTITIVVPTQLGNITDTSTFTVSPNGNNPPRVGVDSRVQFQLVVRVGTPLPAGLGLPAGATVNSLNIGGTLDFKNNDVLGTPLNCDRGFVPRIFFRNLGFGIVEILSLAYRVDLFRSSAGTAAGAGGTSGNGRPAMAGKMGSDLRRKKPTGTSIALLASGPFGSRQSKKRGNRYERRSNNQLGQRLCGLCNCRRNGQFSICTGDAVSVD